MRKFVLLRAMLSAMAIAVAATPAQATSVQTWVASSGTDSGTCPQTAPCATFAYALTQTSTGGAIGCLSGGNFGSVSISGSITIDCGTGDIGNISCSGCTAINISTSSAATIILRHLSIKGVITSGGYGISASMAGGNLIVQHCSITNQNDTAIVFSPTSGRAQLIVSDTEINSNGEAIYINASSGVIVSAMLDRLQITTAGLIGGNPALWMNGAGTIAGTLRQSVVAGSAGVGIYASATGGVYFTVEESSIVDNLEVGIYSGEPGVNLEVGGSTIGGNGTGVYASAGSIYTFGNNQISANGSNGSFTPGGAGLQ
jgi:hypothetical protein